MKKRKFKNGTELYTGNPVQIVDIEHLGAIYVDANVDKDKIESIAALVKPGHEITDTYGRDMRVKDLKRILNELPDDMLVIMPVIDEDDANHICGFRKIRTAGVLICEGEEDREALCLNAAADGQDISDQVRFSGRDVGVKEILFGKSIFDNCVMHRCHPGCLCTACEHRNPDLNKQFNDTVKCYIENGKCVKIERVWERWALN